MFSWQSFKFSFLFIIPGTIEPLKNKIISSKIFNIIGIIITAKVKLFFKKLKLYERNNALGVVIKIVDNTKGRNDCGP